MNRGPTHLKRLGAGAAFLWTVLLLTVPVVVVLFAVFVVAAARSNSVALDIDAAGAVGDRAAAVVDAYIAHLVDYTQTLAKIPAVRALAGEPPPVATADTKILDEAWTLRRTIPAPTDVQRVIDEILANPVSAYFAEICNSKTGVVREILLTDREGRLVAASGPTEDFEQRGEEWWDMAIKRSGSCSSAKDCAYAGDVEFDRSVGALGFDVAVPVFDDTREAVGVLKLVFDPRDIGPLLMLAAANHPVTVTLIRHNGTEVLGDGRPIEVADGDDLSGSALPSLSDALRSRDGQQIIVPVRGQPRPVRALSGPHFATWAVVVLDSSGTPIRTWVQLAALTVVIVVMFLLSARAYALLLDRLRRAE